jgi:RNA polymerase sigma-70 factor (ECF subfamily)
VATVEHEGEEKTEPSDDQVRRFEELIVPEMPFLARIARAMSHSQAEADDLAQETLVKAFRAIDRFDGRYPRAWLTRIARNTAINRDQRNREFVLAEDGVVEPDPAPDEINDPEDIVLGQEIDETLRSALDDLPPDFRIVVQLVDVEDMSYQEAADVLDIPIGTVMSRLHRARTRLRRALSGTALDREAKT